MLSFLVSWSIPSPSDYKTSCFGPFRLGLRHSAHPDFWTTERQFVRNLHRTRFVLPRVLHTSICVLIRSFARSNFYYPTINVQRSETASAPHNPPKSRRRHDQPIA